MNAGDKVKIVLPADADLFKTVWWPKDGNTTGIVQKVFKNGKVAVAVDQLPNRSRDGRATMHFDANELFAE